MTKSQLKDWLSYELGQYPGKPSCLDLFMVSEYSVLRMHQRLLRKTEYYQNTHNKLMETLYRVRLRRLQNRYALHIPLNCCGRGFRIMHLGPVLINNGSVIGKDFWMHFNAVVANRGTDKAAPVIGNGVILGTGAAVIGPVHVANNVVIGANAVVTHDVAEEDIAIAGVPAKMVSRNGRTACT